MKEFGLFCVGFITGCIVGKDSVCALLHKLQAYVMGMVG